MYFSFISGEMGRRALLFSIFSVSFLSICFFIRSMPSLGYDKMGNSCEEVASVTWMIKGVLPSQFGGNEYFGFRGDMLGTAKRLMNCTTTYYETHPMYTTGAYVIVYVTLQAFAIPGPIVLSVLAGALYPYWFANVIISFCACTGVTICYFLTYILGHGLAETMMPKRLNWFRKKVKSNQEMGNLIYYMLFLRLTPLLPNWFVNIASPLADVPYSIFLLGTLVGQLPANMIHTSTGLTLSKLSDDNVEKASNPKFLFFLLFVLQFIALIPTLFKGKLEKTL